VVKGGFFILVVVLAIAAYCMPAQAGWLFTENSEKPPAEPTLFIVSTESNSPDKSGLRFNDVSISAPAGRNIVVTTHGWFEREPWPKNLAILIKDKVDANEWICGWFDWRTEARVINPTNAAKYGRDTAGPMLAKQILQVSKNTKHIHLIGHSAGCWLISEAAKELAKKTNASIHLTFLDAYVPPKWKEDELGDFTNEPNVVYWAEHYFTRDITLKVTERWLTHAHNVDISNITPGLKDHRFPFHWYPATVLGKYDQKEKYGGKKLYRISGNIEYGFARCLESGESNWKQSLELPCGNEAVVLTKAKDL
jgi:hypothetical protein